MPNYTDREHEQVQVLAGVRAGSKDQAAVRLIDLEQMLTLAEVKTKAVFGAPTQDDFNSLLDDLRAISNTVRAVGESLRKKRSR